jgi:selenobiotic family peptide radical SAM maturase
MNTKLKKSLVGLVDFEKILKQVSVSKIEIPSRVENFTINPTLQIIELPKITIKYLMETNYIDYKHPIKNKEWVLLWRLNVNKPVQIKIASKQELLALKILSAGLNLKKACDDLKIPFQSMQNTLRLVSKEGIIIAPYSKIKRINKIFDIAPYNKPKYLTANTFTLQWHITNACDLHCKHCYDRTKRSPLALKQGIEIINQVQDFCYDKRVRGHICFTGGNPFLHKGFFELYKFASKSGFSTSIVGNPVRREKLEKLISIQMPVYYQVSLEGLKNQNDNIRGNGHFDKTLKFLKLLKKLKVSSAVMLTLTKDNINQIIPLAEKLKNYSEHFTFNRLSRTGEGKKLYLPSQNKYKNFLASYLTASHKNSIIGYKDNLLNILLSKNSCKVFSGCTGYGCGAAFNFVALLADGEVHACRKFPSPIGNISKKSLLQIYNSKKAQKYRKGSSACIGCKLRPVCGGCLAISHSYGLDIFNQKDPHCFL